MIDDGEVNSMLAEVSRSLTQESLRVFQKVQRSMQRILDDLGTIPMERLSREERIRCGEVVAGALWKLIISERSVRNHLVDLGIDLPDESAVDWAVINLLRSGAARVVEMAETERTGRKKPAKGE